MITNKKKWFLYSLGGFFLFFSIFVYRVYFSAPYLTVVGVVNMADGLGRQSVELIDSLKGKISIGFLQTSYPCFKGVPRAVKRIIKNQSKPFGKCILFEECLWTPEKEHYKLLKTKKNDSQVRIAYTMFESSKIPDEWVEILNEYFDAAVVPDPYYVKVYEESGVTVPIFVLPLGLNLKPFLRNEIKTKPHFPLVFGNLSALIPRKNHKMLIEAFHEAFLDNENVVLKINARYYDEKVLEELEQIIKENKITNVVITHKSLSAEDYFETFQSIDCYVSISKGEGFSIQPREAMALGIPTIVSDNTAQTTLCKTGIPLTVSSEIREPAYSNWGTILKTPICYGEEFACTKEGVVAALQDMYDNYDYYLARAEKAKEWVKAFDYENLKPYYLALVKPKKVCLSNMNKVTHNTLYTNSTELYGKYKKILHVPN